MSESHDELLASDAEVDRKLIDRVRSHDEQSLAFLYDRHSAQMHGVILRIVKHRSDAEDVLQEAWLQVWRNAEQYDGRRGTVGAWLCTIARSRALDFLRRSARRPRSPAARAESDEIAASDLHVSGWTIVSDHGIDVRAALDALPARERTILEIAYFDGLTQHEIASQLNAPLGSIKTWMRRGLLRLRSILTKGPKGV